MILGVMQPYFFPHLAYFDLIRRSDRWIVFDTVQYQPKSWMNRNRILHPKSGWQYIHAPVAKAPRFAPIAAQRVKDCAEAKRRVVAQLGHYRKKAPHYDAVVSLVEETFSGMASDRLVELNVRGMAAVCARLGIAFDPELFSAMHLSLPPINAPGEWALEICSALGADEYINPPGGRGLFDQAAFERRGIRLTISDPPDLEYLCTPYTFEPKLSILDVLMWNDAERVGVWFDGHQHSL
ncbi:MAG: WbqC family protein [Nitrospinae bacterium]|nr:WbqC family protein [Nitrospinota bacterium]